MSCDAPVLPLRFVQRGLSADPGPFLADQPSCRVEPLDNNYSYAFDYSSPHGILLFPTTAAPHVLLASHRGAYLPSNSSGLGTVDEENINKFFQENSAKKIGLLSQDYWVHVTDSCNLGCFYCYIPEIEKFRNDASDFMSHETAELVLQRVFEDATSRGVRRLHFKFAGGEPSLAIESIRAFGLLADRVFDPLVYHVSFGMITNGVTLPKQLIDILVTRQFNVSFSIDGVERYHDRSRHRGATKSNEGTWQTVIDNANVLQANGIAPFFLHTLTTANIEGVAELQSFLSGRNWNFRISLMRLNNRPSGDQKERFINVLAELFEKTANELPLKTRFERHLQFAEWNIRRKKTMACGSGRNYLAVDAKGGLSSCQMAATPVANLATATIGDARQTLTNSEATKYLVNPGLRTAGCSACFFKHTCAGGCPQHTANVYSTINHVSPWCEVYGSLYPIYVKAAATHLYRRLKFMQNHGKNQSP